MAKECNRAIGPNEVNHPAARIRKGNAKSVRRNSGVLTEKTITIADGVPLTRVRSVLIGEEAAPVRANQERKRQK
jgi:hypothetical protein